MVTLLQCEALNQLSSFSSWDRFSVSYTHASFYSFNEKRQVIKDIVNYNPPMTCRYLRSRGTKSPDSFDAITTSYVDICPPIISVEKKQRQRKKAGLDFHFFILTINMGEERSHFEVFKFKRLISKKKKK